MFLRWVIHIRLEIHYKKVVRDPYLFEYLYLLDLREEIVKNKSAHHPPKIGCDT